MFFHVNMWYVFFLNEHHKKSKTYALEPPRWRRHGHSSAGRGPITCFSQLFSNLWGLISSRGVVSANLCKTDEKRHTEFRHLVDTKTIQQTMEQLTGRGHWRQPGFPTRLEILEMLLDDFQLGNATPEVFFVVLDCMPSKLQRHTIFSGSIWLWLINPRKSSSWHNGGSSNVSP